MVKKPMFNDYEPMGSVMYHVMTYGEAEVELYAFVNSLLVESK
jgi:hypothetical protein